MSVRSCYAWVAVQALANAEFSEDSARHCPRDRLLGQSRSHACSGCLCCVEQTQSVSLSDMQEIIILSRDGDPRTADLEAVGFCLVRQSAALGLCLAVQIRIMVALSSMRQPVRCRIFAEAWITLGSLHLTAGFLRCKCRRWEKSYDACTAEPRPCSWPPAFEPDLLQ